MVARIRETPEKKSIRLLNLYLCHPFGATLLLLRIAPRRKKHTCIFKFIVRDSHMKGTAAHVFLRSGELMLSFKSHGTFLCGKPRRIGHEPVVYFDRVMARPQSSTGSPEQDKHAVRFGDILLKTQVPTLTGQRKYS